MNNSLLKLHKYCEAFLFDAMFGIMSSKEDVRTNVNMRKCIRKITRASTHSYIITIPKELIKKFGWGERQKVEIIFGGKKHELKIRG